MTYETIAASGGLLALGFAIGYVVHRMVLLQRTGVAEQKITQSIEDANRKSQNIILKAKERATSLLEDAVRDEKKRKSQIERQEDRLIKKEEEVDVRQKKLEGQQHSLTTDITKLKEAKAHIDGLRVQAEDALVRAAGVSKEEAYIQLLKEIEERSRQDIAVAIQKLEHEQKEEIEQKGVEIMLSSIQRYARSHVSEFTTSVFHLPNEDFKGKIIGREGRNIRTIERVTGVELIMDENPDAIVISSFDPLRREIARCALEKLVKDGRIQPAKIEEKVEEARQELVKRMEKIGDEAAIEVGAYNLPREIIQLLGRLHFRTSYGQNVLTHSVEMAHISGMLAAELGANPEVARVGALLHDIGKAIDHDIEGTHVQIGRKILKKYNIDDSVIHAMESHHEEYPFATSESFIVAAADALSAARPGARRDSIENYIKRLEELEELAQGFEEVKTAYALSAGREIRVFVVPEKVDDFGALRLARNIAAKIKGNLKYPGEIKVNVIRETRAVEYAR